MTPDFMIRAAVGLLPVACFLVILLYLDSYKLVRLRMVVLVIAAGAGVAVISYLLHALILHRVPIEWTVFTRYVSPLTEELLKGLVVFGLIRARRVGFLVDAAILGFAVGAGFAIIENVYLLQAFPDSSIGTWIVRGFGTAIMHGGATAIFAFTGLAMIERGRDTGVRPFLPGFAIAALLHSAYNHFFLSPIVSTLGILVVLPPLMYVVFRHSGKMISNWLGSGFDANTEMLELIHSGRFSDSPVGQYLYELQDKFRGPVLADLLCYLRLHTELGLRAKGILLMREAGFDAPVGENTRAKFAELRYLEQSIGKTGLLALRPMLNLSHKELWQLYMLGK